MISIIICTVCFLWQSKHILVETSILTISANILEQEIPLEESGKRMKISFHTLKNQLVLDTWVINLMKNMTMKDTIIYYLSLFCIEFHLVYSFSAEQYYYSTLLQAMYNEEVSSPLY